MANRNSPNGFLPVINLDGSGGPKLEYLPLLATNVLIGRGDPVTIAAGGVDKAGASTALCGIAAEPKAANSGGYIAVWSDPNQLFVAQTDDGTGDLTTAADMRKNANIVAGTPVNGQSIAEIDENTGDTTATLPLKVIRLSNEIGNALGEFNRLVVRINNHQLSGGTGTAGLGT
jgi:hypothetical protein